MHLLFVMVVFFASCAQAEEDSQVAAELSEADELVSLWPVHYPAGETLIQQVISTLPSQPIRLDGELQSKAHHGQYQPVAAIQVRLNASRETGRASYDVTDLFGANPQRLVVERSAGQTLSYDFFAGESLDNSPFPGWSAGIRQTDLTWGDLTLSYLWWNGGETVRQERIRGRMCYVVQIPVPETVKDPIGRVDVWIDPKLGMLLRADTLSDSGEVIRSLSVKKFRKIDDVWMVSDIGVTSFPGESKTSLRIHGVSLESAPATGTGPANPTVEDRS